VTWDNWRCVIDVLRVTGLRAKVDHGDALEQWLD
jgi:hypothetical protein